LKKKLQKIITDHELLLTNNDLTKELNSLNSIKNPEQKNKRKKDLNHSLQETPEYIAAGDIYRLKNRLTSTNFFKALDEFGISDQYKENLKLLFSIIFYEYKQTNNSNRDVISKIQQEIEYENKLPKNKEKDKKIQEKISICNKKIEKYLKSVSYKNVRIFKETLFNIIYETYNSLQRIPKKNKKERSNIERSKLEAKIIEKFKSDEDCTKILTRLYKILIRNNITKKILTIYHEDVYIEIPYDNDNKITLDAVKLMYLLAVKQCIQKINQKNKLKEKFTQNKKERKEEQSLNNQLKKSKSDEESYNSEEEYFNEPELRKKKTYNLPEKNTQSNVASSNILNTTIKI
jgi:hypothetical protein